MGEGDFEIYDLREDPRGPTINQISGRNLWIMDGPLNKYTRYDYIILSENKNVLFSNNQQRNSYEKLSQ